MPATTIRNVTKFARGYERRGGSSARYMAGEEMENFLGELIEEFQSIAICLRKDRGQGLLLTVKSSDKRETLYSVYVRNTNARGVDRSPVLYEFSLSNRDVDIVFP